ncbi:BON domain protein [Burkholderia cenocepacia]|nr:BON domain protein [Burkholderia cenocepacia]
MIFQTFVVSVGTPRRDGSHAPLAAGNGTCCMPKRSPVVPGIAYGAFMNSRTPSNPLLNLAVAVACGAAAMYFLDPASGRRRRAYLRDKAVAGRHDVADYANTQVKRAADHARGAIAGLRADWLAGDASDVQVAERVRAALGRLVARPRDIDVSVERGNVCLTGQVEEAERQALIDGVAALHGVHHVEDAMGARSEYKASPDGHSH